MKKILILLIILTSFFFTSNVFAGVKESSCLLPKGDNYFNPENFVVNGRYIENKYPFRVKPNSCYIFAYYLGPHEDYTLSSQLAYEGYDMMPAVELELASISDVSQFEDEQYNACGSTSYIKFYTMSDDDYVIKFKFPALEEQRLDPSRWEYAFYLYEGTELMWDVTFVGSYLDPLPKEDTVYEQAIKEGIYYVDYDKIPSAEEVKKMLQASDNIDGDISDEIYLESSLYDGTHEPIGEYKMVFAVKDSAGNKETFTVIMRAIDLTPPKIIGPESLIVNIGNNDENYYRDLLTVRDNYDDNPSIKVIESNLDNKTPGTYYIKFEASDSSENKSTFTMYVRVHDNYAPVITANSLILDIDYGNSLTLEEIKEIISQRKNITPNELNVIYNDYEYNENVPGEYRLEYLYVNGDKIITEGMKIIVSGSKEQAQIKTEMIIGIGASSLIIIIALAFICYKKFKKKKA